MTGSLIFLITSLGAGLSTSFEILVAFRALQGLGAALVLPSAMSIVTNTFTEPASRNKAIGIFGSFAAIGSGSGLSIGGLVATSFGWQWIFLINVPVIFVTLILSQLFIPADIKPKGINRPDIWSGVLLTASILMLTYVIHELKNIQPHLALLVVAIIVCVGLFVTRIRNSTNPLIDFSLFNSSMTLIGNGVILLMGAFFTGYLFTISLVLQSGMHLSAMKAGLLLFPFSVLSAIVSKKVTPWMLRRITTLQTAIIGMLLMTTGAIMLFLSLYANYNMALLLLSVSCVTGFGIAVCFTSLMVIAVQEIPSNHHGLAASIANTCHFFGGGLGLSVLSLFMDHETNNFNIQLPVIVLGLFGITGAILLVTRLKPRASQLVNQ
jgi:MFS family permease